MKKSDFLPPDSLYQRYAKLHVPDTAAVRARMHAVYSCREKIFLALSDWQIHSSFALPLADRVGRTFPSLSDWSALVW
jgi:hypothetical protein